MSSRLARPTSACIQIWSYGPGTRPVLADSLSEHSQSQENVETPLARSPELLDAVVHCDMVLCIESGPAYEIKWCPLPSYGPVRDPSMMRGTPNSHGVK